MYVRAVDEKVIIEAQAVDDCSTDSAEPVGMPIFECEP